MIDGFKFFTKMADNLVTFAEYDPELADGIKWLNDEAFKKGISFYDMLFEVLYKHHIDKKAKDWLNFKSSSE